MKREFLTQFLNKISGFPAWAKGIIYNKLSEEIDDEGNLSYIFATYKPLLTYKGRCENDFKKSGFDNNIYHILDYADNNYSISEIALNMYLSMEEIARYFLFCVDEGYFEIPDDSVVLNIAGFLAGKYKTGEYFVKTGVISEIQLDTVIKNYEHNSEHKKFGQILVDIGLITEKQLSSIISVKEEAKRRFILDYNEVPQISQEYSKGIDMQNKQIEDLKRENRLLKTKLEQLLAMVKNDD